MLSLTMGPGSQFLESNPLSYPHFGLFDNYNGTPLVKNSTECNLVSLLEALPGDNRLLVKTPCHVHVPMAARVSVDLP